MYDEKNDSINVDWSHYLYWLANKSATDRCIWLIEDFIEVCLHMRMINERFRRDVFSN